VFDVTLTDNVQYHGQSIDNENDPSMRSKIKQSVMSGSQFYWWSKI